MYTQRTWTKLQVFFTKAKNTKVFTKVTFTTRYFIHIHNIQPANVSYFLPSTSPYPELHLATCSVPHRGHPAISTRGLHWRHDGNLVVTVSGFVLSHLRVHPTDMSRPFKLGLIWSILSPNMLCLTLIMDFWLSIKDNVLCIVRQDRQ